MTWWQILIFASCVTTIWLLTRARQDELDDIHRRARQQRERP